MLSKYIKNINKIIITRGKNKLINRRSAFMLYPPLNLFNICVNYPRTEDSWASDFIADCLRVGLTSAHSV